MQHIQSSRTLFLACIAHLYCHVSFPPSSQQVFLSVGNERANSFWAANVPPSEALTPSSCREERRHFISNKYRQGKYRKYHPLFGNQKELNNVSSSPALSLCSLEAPETVLTRYQLASVAVQRGGSIFHIGPFVYQRRFYSTSQSQRTDFILVSPPRQIFVSTTHSV